jgi:hypothetical protein
MKKAQVDMEALTRQARTIARDCMLSAIRDIEELRKESRLRYIPGWRAPTCKW